MLQWRKAISLAGALAHMAVGTVPGHGQGVVPRQIGDREVGGLRLELRETFRVGSLDKPHETFGRVMDAALDRSGRLFVVDDQASRVAVFDQNGRFIRDLAGKGRGPGEVERPWLVTTDATDSVYVWDSGQARLNIFAPSLQFVRSVHLPATWNIGSIDFLPSGEIVIAAMSGADNTGVHVVRRNGSVVRSFIPIDRSQNLGGFESSLLGGTLDVLGRRLVYSRKSPYELLLFDGDKLIARCIGPRQLTTNPLDVIEPVPGRGAWLRWQKYVHSATVVLLDTGLVVNVIVDPTQDQRIVDLVSSDCRLIRRARLTAPVTIVDRVGGRVAAVSNVEFPEVIVYRMEVVRAPE